MTRSSGVRLMASSCWGERYAYVERKMSPGHPWLLAFGFSVSDKLLKGYGPNICDRPVRVAAARLASNSPVPAGFGRGGGSGTGSRVPGAFGDCNCDVPSLAMGAALRYSVPRAAKASTSTPPDLALLRTYSPRSKPATGMGFGLTHRPTKSLPSRSSETRFPVAITDHGRGKRKVRS